LKKKWTRSKTREKRGLKKMREGERGLFFGRKDGAGFERHHYLNKRKKAYPGIRERWALCWEGKKRRSQQFKGPGGECRRD